MKKKMLRCYALILAALMIIPLGGCRETTPDDPRDTEVNNTDETVSPTQDEETDAPETLPPTVETALPETQPPETEPAEDEEYPVLTSENGTYYDYGNGIIRVDGRAFEEYGYIESAAAEYAALVNRVAEQLRDRTTVYCMALPTAIGIVLPDDISEIFPRYDDQGAAVDKLYAKMSDDVVTVNCYRNLMKHRDEYLYFRTDFHWNGPAAYYAYEAFCSKKGVKPYTLDQREKVEFGDFLGALYNGVCDRDPVLAAYPDTVIAYKPYSSSATMQYTDWQGNTVNWSIIADVSGWSSSSKYSTFAGGDSPFAVFTNPEVKDGSVCVIVKESYGNALLPYLVDHYSTVYEIDYRYWEGDLVKFAEEKHADDLIFANNMSMIRSSYLIGMLAEIIK